MSDPMQRLEEIILKIYFDHPNIQQSDYAYMSIPKLQEAKAALLALHKETARAEMLEIIDSKVTLPVSPLWDVEDVRAFTKSFRAELRQQITKRYGTEASHE